MNTLIIIGYAGARRCYLNITLDEAKQRYLKSSGEVRISDDRIEIISFKDEFAAYDIWEVTP